MTEREKLESGLLYLWDDELKNDLERAAKLTYELNSCDYTDHERINALAKELFGKSETIWLNPPFHCSYGRNIELGDNFYVNYNCTIMDVGKVRIGSDCMIGPNVSIYAGGHPIHPATRNAKFQYAIDVEIGNNVWIGGNVVICPGVHIGDNVVIGAGSVVNKDIPSWTFAAGNPCKVIKNITEEDRYKTYANKEADEEARAYMEKLWREDPDPVKYPSA